jgi:hypothetical protein
MTTLDTIDLAAVCGGQQRVLTTGNAELDAQNNAADVGAVTRGIALCNQFTFGRTRQRCRAAAAKDYELYPRHEVVVTP